jgi:ABC-type glycerol-3-phosphate transport system permease component
VPSSASLPIALPGMVAAFILSVVLAERAFFAALLTITDAKTPVMVGVQTGRRGLVRSMGRSRPPPSRPSS